MSQNINDFMSGFVPKTDDTFIAPNISFNSFTQIFANSSGLKTKNSDKSIPVDENQSTESSAEKIIQSKAEISTKNRDKFIDFIVNQYKSDGFISTLDENERQIYYCYYCHQYVNDFDLIQTHIDTSKHLNNILNGISFGRGLDKEFVIESITEKRPKNIHKLIKKELSRIPLHIKHYYFRNNIRLMDVMPPNAYFCNSCSESINNFKLIENHLLTEKHISSQRKPSLMELIDKTDDPVLIIGMQFITEEMIADSSQLVYECQLCDCFDCNYHKMFEHIKSRDHRINLLKKYEYKTQDLTDLEIEILIKEIHEKNGSGLMNTYQINGKPRKGPTTPTSLPPPDSPKTPDPKLESAQRLSPVLLSGSQERPKNEFLRNDQFLVNFEDNKIIQTYESDGREMYYCCYCDEYFNSSLTLERHINDRAHINSLSCAKAVPNDSFDGLNQKFSMKRLADRSSDSTETSKCLVNIPILTKHFYFKRGIRHLSDDLFYCRFCQIEIQNFDDIITHFESETHFRIEEIPTKFNDLLFQTNQPIIGLKYILEKIDYKSKHNSYECLLCDYKQDFCQMFLHLNSFSHQYNVLKRLSPNNPIFKCVKEKEVSLKSSELLKTEILKIEEDIGCGFVTKCIASPKEQHKSEGDHSKSPKVIHESTQKTKICQQMKKPSISVSPVIRSELTKDCPTSNEPFPISDVVVNSEPKFMTAEELLSRLKTSFAVHLESEADASSLVAIVESLRDSLLKYFNVIPVINRQSLPVVETKKVAIDSSVDNYEVCEMDAD